MLPLEAGGNRLVEQHNRAGGDADLGQKLRNIEHELARSGNNHLHTTKCARAGGGYTEWKSQHFHSKKWGCWLCPSFKMFMAVVDEKTKVPESSPVCFHAEILRHFRRVSPRQPTKVGHRAKLSMERESAHACFCAGRCSLGCEPSTLPPDDERRKTLDFIVTLHVSLTISNASLGCSSCRSLQGHGMRYLPPSIEHTTHTNPQPTEHADRVFRDVPVVDLYVTPLST